MTGQRPAKRALVGGAFGAGLAVLTGSTPIGVALVAALGAGVAARSGRRTSASQDSM